MKKRFSFFAVAAALCSSVALGAASGGSCESKAASLKSSQTISLVDEWDPEEKENYGWGVYYLSFSLHRGSSFTVWTSPSEDVMLDVYTNNDDAYVSFETDSTDDGIQYARLAARDWDEEDPSSVKFFVQVSGDIGASVSVYSESGYKSFVPSGTEDNPASISFSTKANSLAGKFSEDGEYWIKASLKYGTYYRVRTEGGTAGSANVLDIVDVEDGSGFIIYEDPEYAANTNDMAFVFSPLTAGTRTYMMRVSNPEVNAGGFSLVYQQLASRTPAQHASTELNAANGHKSNFTPGAMIGSWDYVDGVIDEKLFSIVAAKGERWAFETTGATESLLMQVYDAKGNILSQNTSLDGSSLDCRAVFTAEAVGTYYVGVCEADLSPGESPKGGVVTLTATKVTPIDNSPDEWDAADDTVVGASGLEVVPGTSSTSPFVEGSTHGPHMLSVHDWYDTFVVAARKGIDYRIGFEFASSEDKVLIPLSVDVFTMSGSGERFVAREVVDPGDTVSFTATDNAAYYVRVSTAGTLGLDYPAYNVRAVAYASGGAALGILTVNTPGAPSATWSIGSESVKYPSGSSVLVSGTQTVKFSKVNGYNYEVASKTVTVAPGTTPTVVEVVYSDTFDPKDDTASGATSVTFKNVDTPYATRTLWKSDKADNFAFDGKDGYYYDIALRNVEGDDVSFSISNGGKTIVDGVASVSQLALPKMSSKYVLTVANGAGASVYGGYTLAGKFAEVGAIKFAKTAVSAKENAASVVLAVNRTAKDGYVRVRYGTVAGTARPGEDYVAQSGVLEWASGDNKAKTITVRLIPDLVPFYEGNKTFSVRLEALGEDELAAGEYPASIVGGDTCQVALTETTKPGTTPADAYAKKTPKMATVKTETVGLETGTFFGLLAEDGSALTNGFPSIASITLTASTANPSKLSAKVALAGKSYTFAAAGWDNGEDEGFVSKEFLLAQKVNKIDDETGRSVSVTVTNALTVTVASGATGTPGDWLRAGGTATLVMNVPDANNKGCQEEIVYRGSIYRNNEKIQDYLTAVTNFTGYYTLALVPEGVSSVDGIPAGNGYLTLTIDNKGAVKAAGMLADGATKPSLVAKACAIVPDEGSANGYSMRVPLYFAKAPTVFGGELRLFADESGAVVVDSTQALVWKNDSAAATYTGEEGYSIDISPAGGFYDTVINLQAYYLNRAFEVGTAEMSDFPAENLAAGYSFSTDAEPNGTPVSLAGDVFSIAKKALVKNGKLNNLAASVNPCNVQVKFARATGLVSGSFSLWSESVSGAAQKEITGIKHNGVLVLARDAFSPLADEVVAAGFCFKSVKVTGVNPNTGKTTSRNWTFSLPFNLLGIDQGETDPWADDWGEDTAL